MSENNGNIPIYGFGVFMLQKVNNIYTHVKNFNQNINWNWLISIANGQIIFMTIHQQYVPDNVVLMVFSAIVNYALVIIVIYMMVDQCWWLEHISINSKSMAKLITCFRWNSIIVIYTRFSIYIHSRMMKIYT